MPLLLCAGALGSCERTDTTRESHQPTAPPEIVYEPVTFPIAPPPAAPAPAEDPFKKLDEAKPAPAPATIDPLDVQKEAIRRARELRAESDRMRETL